MLTRENIKTFFQFLFCLAKAKSINRNVLNKYLNKLIKNKNKEYDFLTHINQTSICLLFILNVFR